MSVAGSDIYIYIYSKSSNDFPDTRRILLTSPIHFRKKLDDFLKKYFFGCW